ncbi:MAG: hypothetical protein ACRDD4_05660 [Culicoidibacterales bacterium]
MSVNNPLSYYNSFQEDLIFFEELLYRQLENMFEWEGLPTTTQLDYLERSLIRWGSVMFYLHEQIGFDVMQASAVGFNRHSLPTVARSNIPNSQQAQFQIERNIKRTSDGEYMEFNHKTDCVFLSNIYYGQNIHQIVLFYARKLAMCQQAINTNLLWQNIPLVFQTSSDDYRLSVYKMLSDIFNGKPAVIVDKKMLADNESQPLPTNIPFLVKDLYDVYNEIMMKFKEAIGFQTTGVDKAERVNLVEATSNNDYTTTTLEIMLKQRTIACEALNMFFGFNCSVKLKGAEEQNGTSNSRIGDTAGEDEF